MSVPALSRFSVILAAAVAIGCIPLGAFAMDWKQTTSLNFTDWPWGRFTQISIEYVPDIGDNIQEMSEYADPAKRAALMAEIQAEGMAEDPDAVGKNIVITVPGLEYGMTGTWSNVRIESGNGISVPQDEDKVGSATGAGKGTNYTGELVVIEFNENLLRGSYRAQLYSNKLSMEEINARSRNYLGEVSGELNFDPTPEPVPEYQMAEVPDELSDPDSELLQRIKDAGVPEDVQGQYLEMMRGMDPAMRQMILDSQSDSY